MAKENKMVARLINDIAVSSNWESLYNRMAFDCSEYTSDTINLVREFLQMHHIQPHLYTCDTTQGKHQFLTLSPHETEILFRAFKIYAKHSHLVVDDEWYNAPTEADWQYLSSLIKLDCDDNSTQFPHFFTTDLFIHTLREQTKNSVVAHRIINEFIYCARSYEEQNISVELNLEISQSSKHHKERNSETNTITEGLASIINKQPYIWLKASNFSNPKFFAGVFLHELRHIQQRAYQLQYYRRKNHKPTDMYKAISNLAIEAEARNYDSLVYKNQVSDFIVRYHFAETLKNVLNGSEKFEYADNLKSEEKLAATLKYIQITSYEKALQTSTECYLSKSRYDIYQVLKKNDISMPPTLFNRFVDNIEQWKRSYFAGTFNHAIHDETRTPTLNDEIKPLEELWETKTGLQMKLSPCVVFSEEIARNLGVYDLIYENGQKKHTEPLETYSFTYKGLNKQSSAVREIYEQGKYEDIYDIYNQLKVKNPFLPPIYVKNTEAETALHITTAIIEMHNQSSPKRVIARLGYHTTDYFDTLNWDKTLIGKYAKGMILSQSTER